MGSKRGKGERLFKRKIKRYMKNLRGGCKHDIETIDKIKQLDKCKKCGITGYYLIIDGKEHHGLYDGGGW